jgi:hypothetical protein
MNTPDEASSVLLLNQHCLDDSITEVIGLSEDGIPLVEVVAVYKTMKSLYIFNFFSEVSFCSRGCSLFH